MGKLWAVIKREYSERVRTKWFLVSTIFGPLFLAVMLVLPAWLATRAKASADIAHIIILDATGQHLGDRVATTLAGGLMASGTGQTSVRAVSPDTVARAESLATHAVMRRQYEGYLVLDSATVRTGAARYGGRNATSIPDMEQLKTAVRQSLLSERLRAEGLDPERIQSLTQIAAKVDAQRITDKGRSGSGMVNVVFAFAVAFLLYMTIVLYGQNVLRGVMEEKTTRVAEVVVASVRPTTLLAGKVLGVGAVGLTQQVVWVLGGAALIRLRQPLLSRLGIASAPVQFPDVGIGVLLLLITFFVLGFTFYAALFAAVGSMVNSEQEAQQAATPVILLVVVSAIFIQPVLLSPTSRLSEVVSWLPFSAPILMPVRLSLIPVSPLELAGTIAGLVAACALAVWLAARVFRVGLLMYGKRPSLRELSRWVRYAE